MADNVDVEVLRKEMLGLFQYMKRVRQEIAAIYKPADDDHGFQRMGDQLDAIVQATEQASNSIMEAMERSEPLLEELRQGLSDPAHLALLDGINENHMAVFEACSFQDITGQRVNKLVKSVTYVEDRVEAIIDVWGKATIDQERVTPAKEKTEDEKLLQGPALKDQGISQADIDKLFD